MDVTITAHCLCGQLTATCDGEPVRVSVCHCLNCQRRSGSAFAAQIRFAVEDVVVSGEHLGWTLRGDSGKAATFHFCPHCGSTVFYDNEAMPETRAIPIGAFAGTELPAPWFSIYENRKHPWVEIVGDGIEHD